MKILNTLKKINKKNALLVLIPTGVGIVSLFVGAIASFFITKAVVSDDKKEPDPFNAVFTNQSYWFDEKGTHFFAYDNETNILYSISVEKEAVTLKPVHDVYGQLQYAKGEEPED